jgi:hypothetical protein
MIYSWMLLKVALNTIRNSVCCQTDMGQRLINKETVFQNKCCHVNGHIHLYDSIRQQCSRKGIVQKAKPMCMSEDYSLEKDLCCQERSYVKDGHMLNMSCCGHTPFCQNSSFFLIRPAYEFSYNQWISLSMI